MNSDLCERLPVARRCPHKLLWELDTRAPSLGTTLGLSKTVQISFWLPQVHIQRSIAFSKFLRLLLGIYFPTNISRPQQNSCVEFSSSACFMFWLWWSPASYPSFLTQKVEVFVISPDFSQNHKDFLTKRTVYFVFSQRFLFLLVILTFCSVSKH